MVEYQRLDLMSKILDPWTRGYMEALGVQRGWHCLELEVATTSSNSCETVGSSGSVTSVDINTTLLDLVPAHSLTAAGGCPDR